MELSPKNNYCQPLSLREAIKSRNYIYLEKYLENEQNIYIRDADGFTPLQIALQIDDIEMVRFLLEHKADPNQYYLHGNWKGCSPLHFVLSLRSSAMAMLLIEYKADLFIMSHNKRPAIYNAIKNNRVRVIRYLMDNGISPDSLIDDDTSLLTCAVIRGNIRIVRCILEHKPNVNLHQNQRVIVEAICRCNDHSKRLVKMLYEYGFTLQPADINLKLILAAIGNGHYEAVQNLLKLGISPNFKIILDPETKKTCSILHFAVDAEKLKIIQLILEYGANVNVCDSTQMSPLTIAAKHNNLDIIRLLLKYGANVTNKYNVKILHIAICVKPEFITQNMEKHIDRIKTKIIRLLISKGADVDIKLGGRYTPLYGAVTVGLPSVLKLLLAHTAQVSEINEEGMALLQCAREYIIEEYLDNLNGHQWIVNLQKRLTIFYLRCEVAEILEHHVHRLHRIGVPVDQDNLMTTHAFYKKLIGYDNMIKTIDDEFEYIKATKIDNSYVTLYRFLISTDKESARFVENDVFLKNLKMMLHRPNKFSGYAKLIRKKLTVALARKKLDTGIYELIHFLLKENNVPFFLNECTEHIISFLSDEEKKKIIGQFVLKRI